MDEPIWLLWVFGLAAVVGGPLAFKHRDELAHYFRQKNPLLDSSQDPPGEGMGLLIPAIFTPILGLLMLFYAADRTFGWGIS